MSEKMRMRWTPERRAAQRKRMLDMNRALVGRTRTYEFTDQHCANLAKAQQARREHERQTRREEWQS